MVGGGKRRLRDMSFVLDEARPWERPRAMIRQALSNEPDGITVAMAKHEREAEAVAAAVDAHDVEQPTPCRFCGVGVKAEGARYVGNWRCCERCEPDPAVLAGLLLGEEVEARDAPRWVPAFFRSGPLIRADGAPVRRPWSWVSAEDREHVREEVDGRRWASIPAPCEGLRGCAICGVREALRWYEAPALRWADGELGAVCERCEDLHTLAGGGPPWEIREHVLADLVGASRGVLGIGLDVPVFCEVATADDWSGTEDRYGYVKPDALRRARMLLLGPRPHLALDPAVGATAAADYDAEMAPRRAAWEEERRKRVAVEW